MHNNHHIIGVLMKRSRIKQLNYNIYHLLLYCYRIFNTINSNMSLLEPPTTEKLSQQLHVVLGEEFQISCTATNDEDAPVNLMFSWRTPNGAQFNVTTTDEDDSRTATSTLHIHTVTLNHGGVYQCIVSNGEHQANNISIDSTLVVEGMIIYCIAI